jgi:hypothetical protein
VNEQPRTPSMDDKETPSPPSITLEQYEANKAAGVIPWHEPPEYGEKRHKGARHADELVDGTLPYSPGVPLREAALAAVQERVERYRIAWEKARDDRDRALADCIRDKSHMPDNYWQAEHRARALYGSALQLLDALTPFGHDEG